MNQKKIFFVTGLPRSMSTLMCNILSNDPKIGGGETSPLVSYILATREAFTKSPENQSARTASVMESAYKSFLRNGIDAFACKMTEKPVYIDKGRAWMHYYDLVKWSGIEPKMIVMVRDLRAIVASLEKRRRAKAFMMDMREVLPDRNFHTMEQRVQNYLSDLPIQPHLQRLYNAYQMGTLSKMHIVRAEDLCVRPGQIMKDVYAYLELPYYELDYNNVQQITEENDRIADYSIYGDHQIRNSVTALTPDYEEILTKPICDQIKQQNDWFYKTFKYF